MIDWGGGVFTSCCRCLLAPAVAALALADQLPLPMTVKRGWSGFVPVRRAI